MIRLYRPKPKNSVKVVQWTGDNKAEIKGFCGKNVTFLKLQSDDGTKTKEICVLSPNSIVWDNYYIIRDGRGYFTSCSQKYLDEYYERVDYQWLDTKGFL